VLDDGPHVALPAGVLLVAAFALLGAGWIAIGGRRPGTQKEAVAEAGAAGDDPGVAAIPAVEHRALRRARLRASDDPILAALGLPEEARPTAGRTEPVTELEGRLPRRTQRVKRKRQ
jgi:hypothetical protein